LAANAALALLNVCCYLLDRQLAGQAEGFERAKSRVLIADATSTCNYFNMTVWLMVNAEKNRSGFQRFQ